MPASLSNDPKHWRDRAEEARSVALWMSSAEARLAMLKIAEGYDHLAQLAELRTHIELRQSDCAAGDQP